MRKQLQKPNHAHTGVVTYPEGVTVRMNLIFQTIRNTDQRLKKKKKKICQDVSAKDHIKTRFCKTILVRKFSSLAQNFSKFPYEREYQ